MKLLALFTLLFYALAIGDQTLRLMDRLKSSYPRFFGLAFLAILGHTALLYQWIETRSGQNLNVMNIASTITWLMGILILTPGLTRPLANLSLLIFPISMLSILGAGITEHRHIIQTQFHPGVLVHIIISIIATSLLGLSALQAALIGCQNYFLKTHHPNPFSLFLPSIETMEHILFTLIWAGFIFLTCSLLTGLVYIEQFFSFNIVSKSGLAICAWALFLVLLVGHHVYGWRGRKAIKLTLGGTIALLIAYFGTQINY